MRSFVCNCAFLILPAFGWTQTIVHLGTSQITASAIGLSDTHPAISGDSLGAGISFNLSIAASSTTTPALTLSQHPDGIGVAGGSYYEIDNRNNLDPGDDETMTFSLSQVAGLAEGQSLCITAIGIRSIASDTKQYSLTDASGTRAGTFNSSPFVIDVSNQASVSLSAVGPNSGAVVYSRFIVNQLHLQVVADDGGGDDATSHPSPRITATGIDSNGHPYLSFHTQSGANYQIQSSTALSNPTIWTTLATRSGTGAAISLTDTSVDTHNQPQAFYRVTTAPPTNGKLTDRTLTIEQNWAQEPTGFERTADVIVPSGSGPHPVVIMLHGNGGTSSFINSMGSLLDSVIRVAPNGYLNSWNVDNEGSKAPDVAFLRELIEQLKSYDNVDPERISIYGSSNGAGMTNRLLIDLDGDAFQRAACSVSQMITKMYHDGSFWTDPVGDNSYSQTITPAAGRHILTISGDADPLIPYTGGNGVGTTFMDAQESTYRFAQAMGESGTQLSDASGVSGNLNDADPDNDFSPVFVRYRYLNGQVEHYKLRGGNHSLHVNGANTYSTEAKQLIADFLLN